MRATFTKLVGGGIRRSQRRQQNDVVLDMHRRLIRREAELGGQLFGEVKSGDRREFFCLDENTWVWHEEKTLPNGSRQVSTTRYDVRRDGILKAQNGSGYQSLSLAETENFRQAAQLYRDRVLKVLYPDHSQTA